MATDTSRLVSLVPSATEVLFAIGAGPWVVGVSHECDFPAAARRLPQLTRSRIDSRQDSRAIDQQTRDLLARGEPLYELDAAAILDLRPDWILTQAQCDVCAVRYDDVLALLREHGQLAATGVLAVNPQRLQDVLDDVRRIGGALGLNEAACRVATELQRRIDRVSEIGGRIPAADRPRVACVEWLEPLMLAGNWVPGMLELAGGDCSLTPDGGHSGYLTWQDLRDFDPQVMLLLPCGMDLARTVSAAQELRDRDGWRDLSAVRNGRVFAVDGNSYFNRSGPRLVDSLEILLHCLHPGAAQRAGIFVSSPPATAVVPFRG
jgi:iron complex transport system substrate-binding protein